MQEMSAANLVSRDRLFLVEFNKFL